MFERARKGCTMFDIYAVEMDWGYEFWKTQSRTLFILKILALTD